MQQNAGRLFYSQQIELFSQKTQHVTLGCDIILNGENQLESIEWKWGREFHPKYNFLTYQPNEPSENNAYKAIWLLINSMCVP